MLSFDIMYTQLVFGFFILTSHCAAVAILTGAATMPTSLKYPNLFLILIILLTILVISLYTHTDTLARITIAIMN